MSAVTVGKWGKSLAIRVPIEVATAAGLREGERVDIASKDGELIVRRPTAPALADAQAAAEELIQERRKYSLGDIALRDLIDEGRRG